jgi:hypothetical protein
VYRRWYLHTYSISFILKLCFHVIIIQICIYSTWAQFLHAFNAFFLKKNNIDSKSFSRLAVSNLSIQTIRGLSDLSLYLCTWLLFILSITQRTTMEAVLKSPFKCALRLLSSSFIQMINICTVEMEKSYFPRTFSAFV